MKEQLSFASRRATHTTATHIGSGMQRGLLAWITAWIDVCADYYAATAMYEQLSRLSDAELQRRGLERANLALHVCAAVGRSGRSH